MKIICKTSRIDFPFEKYCTLILKVVPKDDLLGIKEIRFVDDFSHPKADLESLGIYLQGTNGKDASIEIHIPNIIEHQISEFNFIRHPEVSALLLSQTIFHEIGHHVHYFKRHGIKKKKHEHFANKYKEAGYYHYLKSRESEILSSYKWGALNIIELDKEGRDIARQSHDEIIAWLDKNKDGIPFPRD